MNHKGFTLIELIVVMGILAILATIVVIAVNPGRQFAASRNTKRYNDTRALANAIMQHAADNNGQVHSSITAQAKFIGTTSATNFVDLTSVLVPNYLSAIPFDPQNGSVSDTKYIVYKNNNEGVRVEAAVPELNKTISNGSGINYALNLTNSANNYASAGDPINGTLDPGADFTLSAWFYRSASGGTGGITKSNGDPTTGNTTTPGYSLVMWGGNIIFKVESTGVRMAGYSGVNNLNTLYHIVAHWNATTQSASLYVNGALVATNNTNVTGTVGNVANVLPFRVGCLSDSYCTSPNHTYPGYIDDIKFYNRALTQTEITALYYKGTITNSLQASYQFNEGSGTSLAVDSSPNGNNLTLFNSPGWAQMPQP